MACGEDSLILLECLSSSPSFVLVDPVLCVLSRDLRVFGDCINVLCTSIEGHDNRGSRGGWTTILTL